MASLLYWFDMKAIGNTTMKQYNNEAMKQEYY